MGNQILDPRFRGDDKQVVRNYSSTSLRITLSGIEELDQLDQLEIYYMNISLAPEVIFHIGSFPVTNSILTAWITILLLLLITLITRSKLSLKTPKGLQIMFEFIITFLYDMTESIMGKKDLAKKLFPLLATFFFFILVGSWLGLLPGVGSIGIWEQIEGKEVLVPLFRAPTSDINAALVMALITMVTVQVVGLKHLGFFKYGKKFLNFSGKTLFDRGLNLFVSILEGISEISKIISFTFRLFGNIFAGEVLITVMTFLIPYAVPIPFLGFEIFVGVIQAFVFFALSTVFMSLAVQSHEEH